MMMMRNRERKKEEKKKMCVKLATAHLCIHPKPNTIKNAMHPTSDRSALKGLYPIHESQFYSLMR